MSQKLDKYLQTLAHELRGLPAQQRESELREMRQHLEAIVARLMEGGLSHEEAMEAALSQFGAARQVGRKLEAVASREPWWRTLLAPICGMACGYALHALFRPAENYLIPMSMPATATISSTSWVLVTVLDWLIATSSGAVAGYLSPRWGVRLLLCLMSARWIVSLSAGMQHMGGLPLGFVLWMLMKLLINSSGACLGSHLVRRLQGARTSGPTEVA